MEGINVLSLFDGIACGRVALEKIGINVNNYYSSEINQFAMQIAKKNYPDIIELGNIKDLDCSELPKIDLLIGGSPCTNLSVAGKKDGFIVNDLDGYMEMKRKGYDFGRNQSHLFWEYVRILNEVKPKYFLLENVKMKKQWVDIINNALGVEAIEINSSLQSAQYRRRLYWTNIPNVDQPEDKEIYLEDILQDNITGGVKAEYIDGIFKHKAKNGKNIIIEQEINPPFSLYESRTEKGKAERRRLRKLLGRDTTPRGVNDREYRINKKFKANCIVATSSELDNVLDKQYNYRKLTLTEMERLQTLPDGYTEGISDNQRRKAIGNGWTVDIIAHIFRHLL